MASEVGIANSALRKIGAKVITSFDDGSPSANFISDRYEDARDELLRMHPWNFAVKRDALARLTDAPEFEFTYYYALPDDWLRTLGVFDNDAGTGVTPYQEETNKIAANTEQIYLRYVARIKDPNEMPPDFRETLACLLAMDAAINLANSGAFYDRMKDAFDQRLMTAKSTDALANRGGRLARGSWVTRRARSQVDWPE